MPWRRFASLLLCLTLCGCGATDPRVRSPSVDAPTEAASQADTPSVLQDTPLDTVTYLPESLIEEMRALILKSSEPYTDLAPLDVGQMLSEDEAAALAPDCLSSSDPDASDYSIFYAVDFDNDSTKDLFIDRKTGMGTMGMHDLQFWRGLPDGTYIQTGSLETYMSSPLFVDWDNRTYLLLVQYDFPDKSDVTQLTFTGLDIMLFDNGQIQESACLTFDPTALWEEGIYDEDGIQTGWIEGAPEERDVMLSVYTRGINTDFSAFLH